ncbi:MAG: hypothetical protein J3K34DRAFT_403858 [Monoraphidium minutum]|nr:MAG: hypothetical protein J3K34DRAFT_403858 [Monoraphidium minutum]
MASLTPLLFFLTSTFDSLLHGYSMGADVEKGVTFLICLFAALNSSTASNSSFGSVPVVGRMTTLQGDAFPRTGAACSASSASSSRRAAHAHAST